ncbi:MAG: ABC transporter ATP-binding protein [Halofilum sp. (in: g-proteobacteria)]|nr:ABC transporter ATP-binding protein [Halofilum sp. (in: g-proteobacteria)]
MPQPGRGAQAARVAIDCTGLRFRWHAAGAEVLDIPSFRVVAGERVFLCGPSGSGKSTLLGLIGGVLEPAAGELQVLDTDIPALSPAARDRFRADHIGFIFQQFNLLPYLGVVDNVLLGTRFSPRRSERLGRNAVAEARRCLAALGLADESQLTSPVTSLSVGQQQRVAAARALLGRPELVIADEPTSSLDADVRAAFLQLLFDECAEAGATLLFVSHDPSLQAGFDRVVELPNINRAGQRS